MEICLMIEGQEDVGWPQWLDLARACEEHGIGTLYRSDHYMNLDGQHPERGSLDAWASLCGLAAVTSTLRLGTMVSPATFRHPSEVAKVVVTADHISGGRVDFGLGAGWHDREHAAYGFPYPAAIATRIDVMEEQLQIVLGSWASASGEPFSFEGEHYRLETLRAEPGPVQAPHPPVIMGGAAGRRVSAIAARYADEYNTAFATREEIGERRANIQRACEAAGREMMPFSLMTGVVVGETPADVQDRATRLEKRTSFPVASDPPDSWLIGTVEQVAQQLDALAQSGVDRVLCNHMLPDDLDMVALLGGPLAAAVR